MLTLKDLLEGKDFNSLSPELQANMLELLDKLNKIRIAYGKPFIVTSCLRTMEQHLAIYSKKGITDPNKIPMQSLHLRALACDFSDPKGEIDTWLQNNVPLLESVGVWVEHPDTTPRWAHLGIRPPKSGNRFFYP